MNFNFAKENFKTWIADAALVVLSPSRWPDAALRLLGFFLTRAVVLSYCAILFFLIARSSNLQIIGIFQDISAPFLQALTSAIVATSATIMFAVRRPHNPGITYFFDVPVFFLPLIIMVFFPPWGAMSWGWTVAAFIAQALVMLPLIKAPLWEFPLRILSLLGNVLGGFIVLYFMIWLDPVGFGRLFGVVVWAALFVGLSASLIAILLRWPQWAFAVFIWLIVAFSQSFEFEHEAQYRPLPDYEAIEYGTADPFAMWLFDRADADFYRQNNLPYPVFLISSEGGGGYAKAHAYSFMSKASERCRNFAQHVYAMVGVSGGQIGNTMYHSHMQPTAHQDVTPCTGSETTSHAQYLSIDHLSPLTAHLLFVEIPRRLLLLGAADVGRTEVLVDSFNKTSDGYGPIPDIAFRKHFWRYNTEQEYAAELTEKPALVSVAVDVETGNRYVFSPFFISTRAQSHIADYTGNGTSEPTIATLAEPSLSSASVASASFPWVTPSLRFSWERPFDPDVDQSPFAPEEDRKENGPPQKGAVNLVDGGYFENTGAETMSEIMADMMSDAAPSLQCHDDPEQRYYGADPSYSARAFPNGSPCAEAPPACFSLDARYVPTMLNEVDWGACEVPFAVINIIIRDTPAERTTGGPQNFLRDPLHALLNARSARGNLAVATLEERKCGFSGDISSCWANADATGSGDPYPQLWSGMFQSRINSGAMQLPLGWDMPLDRMKLLETYVAPNEETCTQVGVPLFDPVEIYEEDFLPNSEYPPELDLLLKRNCSHLRQIGLMFDVEGLKYASEWRP